MVKYISPGKHLLVSKTFSRDLQDMSWRRLQDMSSRRFQDVFSVTIFCLPRRPQDFLRNVFKTSWKTKNCYAEDVFKTSSRHVLETSWRRLEDQQMFAGYELFYTFFELSQYIFHTYFTTMTSQVKKIFIQSRFENMKSVIKKSTCSFKSM